MPDFWKLFQQGFDRDEAQEGVSDSRAQYTAEKRQNGGPTRNQVKEEEAAEAGEAPVEAETAA